MILRHTKKKIKFLEPATMLIYNFRHFENLTVDCIRFLTFGISNDVKKDDTTFYYEQSYC